MSANRDEPRLMPSKPHLPFDSVRGNSLDHLLSVVERKEILRALRRAGGRRTVAARLLGISRSRLYRRMDALVIIHAEPTDGRA